MSTEATRPARPRRPRVRGALTGLTALAAALGTALAAPAGAATTTTSAPAQAPVPLVPGASASSGSTLAPGTGANAASGSPQPQAQAPINGVGSSFAAPAIESFTKDVSQAPYSLGVNYSSTNSGDGRYEFTNQTTDYAVSDIGYVGNTDTTPPSFPFIFVPITAGGIAFMYNIPGLSKTLQLNSYTACAVLTGGITNWNDPKIAQQNPGVSLPNLKIIPVTESDSAGTNYVLEEWCIDEQPALWAAFAQAQTTQPGGPTDGVAISATSPNSNWPGIHGGLDDQTTTAVAGDVATNAGAIGAVQMQYAVDLNFGTGDTSKGVASVQNASGDYTQPNPVDVASALAYATQQANGTHVLNFNGTGPHVYNPSTYSYLLTKTTGWNPSKGATMSAFVNYALTLGQQQAPQFGYASLGLSLERYGVNAVTQDVPGSVAVTAAEKQAYACGDLTPQEVQAGQTTPTCGVLNSNEQQGPPPPNGGAGGGSGTTGTSGSGSGAGGAGAGGSGSGGAGGVDAGVSLSGTSSMAMTGADPFPLLVVGGLLLVGGYLARRRVLRRRRPAEDRP
jgi:ABC-type phosphate transport system substrate-binding protein